MFPFSFLGIMMITKHRNAPDDAGNIPRADMEGQAPMLPKNTPELESVPYGYCQCGCGEKAPLASRNESARGYVKGEPLRFLPFHNLRLYKSQPNDIVQIDGGVATLAMSKGEVLLVDVANLDRVRAYRWSLCATRRGAYAMTKIPHGNGQGEIVLLHRLLTDAPQDVHVDHVNGNGLDNRMANLRLATPGQNQRNRRLSSVNTTGYKGVSFDRCRGKYTASIKSNYKTHFLGRFDSPQDAAKAYDAAARDLHGTYATLNFPRDGERGA